MFLSWSTNTGLLQKEQDPPALGARVKNKHLFREVSRNILLGSFCLGVPFATTGARMAMKLSSQLFFFFPLTKITYGYHFLCRLHDELLISCNEEELGQ